MASTVSSLLAGAAGQLVEGGIPKVQAAKMYLHSQRDAIPYEMTSGISGQILTTDLRLQPHLDALENIPAYVEKLLSQHSTQLRAEVSVQWSVLNTEVRSRLLETGGKWLDGVHAKELNKLVGKVTGSSLEDWRQEGPLVMSKFQRLNRALPGATIDRDFIRLAQDEFNSWFEQILSFIDAVADLIIQSAAAAEQYPKSSQ
jgi:hypothetical protein